MAITNGLLAYWKFDESSGNAIDSLFSYAMVNNNSVSYVAGLLGNCADFGSSNTNKYFNLANNLGINGGAFSFNFWVNMAAAPASSGDVVGLIGQFNSSNKVNNRIYYRNSGGTLGLYFNRLIAGISNNGPDVNQTLTLNTWYMITMTYDGTTVRGYVNGSEIGNAGGGSGTGTDPNYYNGVVLGTMNSSSLPDRPMSGKMDACGIWNRALTTGEITTLYNGGTGRQYPFQLASEVVGTYLQTTGDATDQSTYTFNGVNFGEEASNRKIVIAVSGRAVTNSPVLSSATIGGVSATIAVQGVDTAGLNIQAIIIATVPTGTTGTVVLNFSETLTNADISVYTTFGIGSNTATDTGTSTANAGTTNLDIAAGGIAFGLAKNDNGTQTATWTNLVETYDAQDANTNDISGAFDTFATQQTNLTCTCTWSGTPTRPIAAFASFAPVQSSIKTIDGLAVASVKTVNGLAIASMKTFNGLQ